MNRTLASLLGSLLLAAGLHAQSFIKLQPTQGTAQTGYGNITGSLKAGTFLCAGGAAPAAGKVLLADSATACHWASVADAGAVTLPLSLANGGTGADLSGAGTGAIPYIASGPAFLADGKIAFAWSTGDSAVGQLNLSATDTNGNLSTVQWGIELPGDGSSPGDLVARTAGTERVRVLGTIGTTRFFPDGVGSAFEVHAGNGSHEISTFQMGPALSGGFSLLAWRDIEPTAPDEFLELAHGLPNDNGFDGLQLFHSGPAPFGEDAILSIRADGTTSLGMAYNEASNPASAATTLSINRSNNVMAVPLGGISVTHPTLPSAFFQNFSNGAPNPSPTMILMGDPNGQTSPLMQAIGTDGTTVVGSMGIGGAFDATAYSLAGTPLALRSILVGTTGSIGGGLLTAGNCATGTATVTGAVVGNPVSWSTSDGTLPSPLAIISAAVTSTNTVSLQVCAVATLTPASKTYNVSVVQ